MAAAHHLYSSKRQRVERKQDKPIAELWISTPSDLSTYEDSLLLNCPGLIAPLVRMVTTYSGCPVVSHRITASTALQVQISWRKTPQALERPQLSSVFDSYDWTDVEARIPVWYPYMIKVACQLGMDISDARDGTPLTEDEIKTLTQLSMDYLLEPVGPSLLCQRVRVTEESFDIVHCPLAACSFPIARVWPSGMANGSGSLFQSFVSCTTVHFSDTPHVAFHYDDSCSTLQLSTNIGTHNRHLWRW